jgi:16S rRNA (adenine(1408)-N(1))-methyltransferase
VNAVRGTDSYEVTRSELEEIRANHARVVVDLGTGDGRHAYRLAADDPGAFVIGLDSAAGNLAETSRRAARKPARGGLPNLLLVVGRAEELPPELDGLCDEILVILPWGRLLVDVALGNAELLAGIRRIARADATFRAVLNTEIFEEPVPVEARDLPTLTVEYAEEELRPRYTAAGIEIGEARFMTQPEVATLHSTWSRKLAHGREPRFLLLDCRVADER